MRTTASSKTVPNKFRNISGKVPERFQHSSQTVPNHVNKLFNKVVRTYPSIGRQEPGDQRGGYMNSRCLKGLYTPFNCIYLKDCIASLKTDRQIDRQRDREIG